jgi:hypothetical protein
LRVIDQQVLAESEPFYEGDGRFRVELPDDPYEQAGQPGTEEQFEAVLDELVARIEHHLRVELGFENGS